MKKSMPNSPQRCYKLCEDWLRQALKTTHHLLSALAALCIAMPAFVVAANDAKIEGKPDASQLEFFEKNIRPVLASRCYKCHSAEAEKPKGGLLLDTREGIRMGGDSGHAVVPGSLSESLLIKAIRHTDKDLQMPPEKAGGKLPDTVIADFEKWVQMGAADPRDGESKVVRKKLTPDEARDFWAFKPPRAAPTPKVADEQWPRTDIDRFVLAGIETKGMKPVGDADRRAIGDQRLRGVVEGRGAIDQRQCCAHGPQRHQDDSQRYALHVRS